MVLLNSSCRTSPPKATLTAQAAAIDAIFPEPARRGALNLGEYLSASETYFRLALKAQSQCRATLEALAEIKNTHPVAFVQQANIAHGPQQVNYGAVPPHGKRSFNNQTNYHLEVRMSYHRTPKHRRLQAELIQKWKPCSQPPRPNIWRCSADPTTGLESTADAGNRKAGVAFGRGCDVRLPSHDRPVVGQSCR